MESPKVGDSLLAVKAAFKALGKYRGG